MTFWGDSNGRPGSSHLCAGTGVGAVRGGCCPVCGHPLALLSPPHLLGKPRTITFTERFFFPIKLKHKVRFQQDSDSRPMSFIVPSAQPPATSACGRSRAGLLRRRRRAASSLSDGPCPQGGCGFLPAQPDYPGVSPPCPVLWCIEVALPTLCTTGASPRTRKRLTGIRTLAPIPLPLPPFLFPAVSLLQPDRIGTVGPLLFCPPFSRAAVRHTD